MRRGIGLALVLLGVAAITASPAGATTLYFLDMPDFAVGFDPAQPGFPTTIDYTIPSPTGVVAADPTGTADVTYSLTQEFFLDGMGSPVANVFAGSTYASIVTLTLTDVAGGSVPASGVLLFLSGLGSSPSYPVTDVGIVQDIASSQIPGQSYGFTGLSTIAWNPAGTTYYYLGAHLSQIGDQIVFRYDFDASGTATPKLLTNASYSVIPEPATALLMGLGLVGLAVASRR